MHHPGSKPIVKSHKLQHRKRTIVERQELAPRVAGPNHARWRIQAGGVMMAAAIAASAGAQAAPPRGGLGADRGGLGFGPIPATEVAIAPRAETDETLIHFGPPAELAGFEKVSDLKENPYVASATKARPKLTKKARPAATPAYVHVDDLKANPY